MQLSHLLQLDKGKDPKLCGYFQMFSRGGSNMFKMTENGSIQYRIVKYI